MMYKNIKSEYIKNKIKETSWEKRDYIDDLIKIERRALGEFSGSGTGYIVKQLESDYPKEWEIIWKEINPERYAKMVEEEKEWQDEKRRREEEEELKRRKEEEEKRKEWIEMEGRM